MSGKESKKIRKALRKAGMDEIMTSVARTTSLKMDEEIARKTRAILKPKSKWLPNFIHKFLVNKLIMIEVIEESGKIKE